MSCTSATKDYTRTVNETFAIVRAARISTAKLLTLGYASAAAAATALASATVEMHVPLIEPDEIVVTADVAAVSLGEPIGVELTITIQPPVELTDVVHVHDYYVVLEPGSATSEKRLWRGRWTVEASQETV